MENPIADQARALATQGSHDQAVDLLRQTLLTQPNDLSVRFALGELLYRAHLFQEALPHLEVCRDHPDYMKAWLYCSNVFGFQKDFRQSFRCLYQFCGEEAYDQTPHYQRYDQTWDFWRSATHYRYGGICLSNCPQAPELFSNVAGNLLAAITVFGWPISQVQAVSGEMEWLEQLLLQGLRLVTTGLVLILGVTADQVAAYQGQGYLTMALIGQGHFDGPDIVGTVASECPPIRLDRRLWEERLFRLNDWGLQEPQYLRPHLQPRPGWRQRVAHQHSLTPSQEGIGLALERGMWDFFNCLEEVAVPSERLIRQCALALKTCREVDAKPILQFLIRHKVRSWRSLWGDYPRLREELFELAQSEFPQFLGLACRQLLFSEVEHLQKSASHWLKDCSVSQHLIARLDLTLLPHCRVYYQNLSGLARWQEFQRLVDSPEFNPPLFLTLVEVIQRVDPPERQQVPWVMRALQRLSNDSRNLARFLGWAGQFARACPDPSLRALLVEKCCSSILGSTGNWFRSPLISIVVEFDPPRALQLCQQLMSLGLDIGPRVNLLVHLMEALDSDVGLEFICDLARRSHPALSESVVRYLKGFNTADDVYLGLSRRRYPCLETARILIERGYWQYWQTVAEALSQVRSGNEEIMFLIGWGHPRCYDLLAQLPDILGLLGQLLEEVGPDEQGLIREAKPEIAARLQEAGYPA